MVVSYRKFCANSSAERRARTASKLSSAAVSPGLAPVWTADDIGAAAESIGLAGSPTQVHRINFVVLESTESRTVQPTPQAIAAMVAELVHEYIVG